MSQKRYKTVVALELARRKALNDFYFFCNRVLGYDLMAPHVHQGMCDFLTCEIPRGESEQATKIDLEARGTFKSTIGTIAYPLWRLARNPNLTILLNNEKQERVIDFLRAIKFHITDNQTFRTLFGDWSCKKDFGKRWNENRIDVAPRTIWGPSASIDTASTTSSTVGKHADLIINDDLVGESNVTTIEQLRKVDEFVKNLGAVLNPGGEMIFIGTRWHHLDTYNTQLEHIKSLGEFARAKVRIKSCYNEDGSLFFPERLSEQFLKTQRVKLGTYFFSCQYLNEPVNREDALIQRIDKYGEKIHGMPSRQYFMEECNIFITMDLAYTDTARSDNTVIFIEAVHPKTGMRYVVDYHVFKTTKPEVVIDKMFEVEDAWHPLRWGIESNNYKSWLQKPLQDEMRKRGKFLNIDPEDGLKHYGKTSNDTKNARLVKVAPVMNLGMCQIAEWMTDLEDQCRILTYNGVKGKDDLFDAFAMQEEIIFWGSEEPSNKYDNEESKMEGRWWRGDDAYQAIGDTADDDWMYAGMECEVAN